MFDNRFATVHHVETGIARANRHRLLRVKYRAVCARISRAMDIYRAEGLEEKALHVLDRARRIVKEKQ